MGKAVLRRGRKEKIKLTEARADALKLSLFITGRGEVFCEKMNKNRVKHFCFESKNILMPCWSSPIVSRNILGTKTVLLAKLEFADRKPGFYHRLEMRNLFSVREFFLCLQSIHPKNSFNNFQKNSLKETALLVHNPWPWYFLSTSIFKPGDQFLNQEFPLKIFLVAAATLLSLNALALEPITEAKVSQAVSVIDGAVSKVTSLVAFKAWSGGCTKQEHFSLDIQISETEQLVTVVRNIPDICEAAARLVDVEIETNELELSDFAGKTVKIVNPVAVTIKF